MKNIVKFFDIWIAVCAALVVGGMFLALAKLKVSLTFMALGILGFIIWIIVGIGLAVYTLLRRCFK